MGDRRPKEDGVYNISTSIFITNFPDQTNAKELWRLCNQYGNVIDSFIPNRRSKVGKHFGFVRFIKIYDVERLVNNLCTIWIGNFKLHANIAKFNRTPLHKGNHLPNIHANVRPAPVVSSKTHGDSSSYIQAVKAGVNLHSVVSDAKVSKPALLLDDSCLNVSDYSLSLVGKLKEFSSLPNLKMLLVPSFETAGLRPETDHLSPKFSLSDLPSAPRGVVKAIVCYEIDANGILNVSAREITTGRNKSIQITNNCSLSKVDIEKMIKDAERYKLEDEAYVNKVKAQKALDDYIYKLKSNIKNYNVRLRLRSMGLSVKDLEDLEHQIEMAAEWLDENPDAEIDEIEGKKEELDDICRRSHLNLVLKGKKRFSLSL
ncbi:nucleotide-binding alpha-beta plait domain-containing protein [Tanacetum coccineum]